MICVVASGTVVVAMVTVGQVDLVQGFLHHDSQPQAHITCNTVHHYQAGKHRHREHLVDADLW